MRVLFVEDNPINRRVILEMLRAGDIEMSEAPDGRAGLEMIEQNDYDLILMDLRMPGMDGLTAIRRLRARGDAKAAMPVIVVTADSAADIREDCLKAGADDMLVKPVVMGELYDTIGRVLAKAGDGAAMIA